MVVLALICEPLVVDPPPPRTASRPAHSGACSPPRQHPLRRPRPQSADRETSALTTIAACPSPTPHPRRSRTSAPPTPLRLSANRSDRPDSPSTAHSPRLPLQTSANRPRFDCPQPLKPITTVTKAPLEPWRSPTRKTYATLSPALCSGSTQHGFGPMTTVVSRSDQFPSLRLALSTFSSTSL